MSAPHSSQHDDVLARVLAGDLGREDAEVTRMLSRCEVCRDKLRDLDSLAGELDSLADLQTDVLREAATLTGAPGEDRIGDLMRPERTVASPVSWTRQAVLAAAVLIGALSWWALAGDTPRADPDADLYLHAHETHALSPFGPVESFASFSWSIELPPGGHYRVAIWQLDEKNAAEPRLTSENLTSGSWTLTDEEQRDLPDEIYWEVQTYDAFGGVEQVGTSASR